MFTGMENVMNWFETWKKRLFKKHTRRSLRSVSRFKRDKLLFYASVGAFVSIVAGFILTIAVFAWVGRDLPSPSNLVRKEGFATRIYDRNGEVLYDFYKEAKRDPVSWEDVPDSLKLATIAIEDKEFYTHPGFSIKGIARAAYNIVVHQSLQGGSTLTQQLIKNVLLTPERTPTRKLKELILTLQAERKYSKDEILLMYLNEAPYGGTAWGVGAASEQYLGKKVSELNLVESAFLAGLPQRPSVYSPFSATPDAFVDRTKSVLRRMEEDDYISSQEHEEALEQLDQMAFAEDRTLIKAPHFVLWIKKLLEEKYGPELTEQGGLRVTTTLDLSFQEEVEKIVQEEIDKVESLNITNGAVVALDPQTGQILALVGSKDYFSETIDGKYNVVTQGLRQPGSSIKPLTYALALEKGYTAATPIFDARTVFPIGSGQPDYIPVNYDGKYHGPMNLRTALGNSINVPAVKLLGIVGVPNMLEKAYQMGMTTLEPTKENLSKFGLSLTLGGGDIRMIEMTSAYTAFANQGEVQQANPFLTVTTKDGKVLEEYKPIAGKKVFDPGIAYIISDILSDDNARLVSFGSRSGLYIPNRKVAVKTGTTNDLKDNWAIGWTPEVIIASWVGNNDNSSMKSVASGISGATPIWRRAMMAAIDQFGYSEFPKPGNISQVEVDVVSGYPAHDGFASKNEYFINGTVPNGSDPIHVKMKTCRNQDKLATPALVSSGDYDEKEYFIFVEQDPVSKDGKNRWQEAILNWTFQQEDSRYHPPSDYCDDSGLISIRLTSPGNETTVDSKFLVKVDVSTIKDLKEIQIEVNGKRVQTINHKPYEAELKLDDGTYFIKAIAFDQDNNRAEAEVKVGVNLPWDWEPSPTPKPTKSAPTATPPEKPTPSPTLKPSPTGTED